MDVKLEHLIEKIKKDGVDEAELVSQDIVLKAREEATFILEKARRKSEEIIR